MIPVFSWERRFHLFILHTSSRIVNILKWVNIALAGEESVTIHTPALTAWIVWQGEIWGLPWLASFLICRHVEAWAKPLLGSRGRPRDVHEPGMPSGDCAIVTIWSVPLLGWWATPVILLVAWARVAQSAHWPLDTVVGVGLGLFLLIPAVANLLW